MAEVRLPVMGERERNTEGERERGRERNTEGERERGRERSDPMGDEREVLIVEFIVLWLFTGKRPGKHTNTLSLSYTHTPTHTHTHIHTQTHTHMRKHTVVTLKVITQGFP